MRHRVLNDALYHRYLTEDFGCDLRVKRKDKYLYNGKSDNITRKNTNFNTFSIILHINDVNYITAASSRRE